MSRYIAHVQQTNGAALDIDCDAAHVNDGGVLSLSINTYIGAIACWQPEAWDSYQLESPPHDHPSADVPFTSINAERDRLGMPPLSKPRLIPIPTPKVGDEVDFTVPVGWCSRVTVTAVSPDGTVDIRTSTGHTRHGVEYDCQNHEPLTWHWPCAGKREATTEPDEPAVPAQSVVTVTINGSTPVQLGDAINRQLLAEHRAYPGPLRNWCR